MTRTEIDKGDQKLAALIVSLHDAGHEVSYWVPSGQIVVQPDTDNVIVRLWAEALAEAHKATQEIRRWQARN